MSVARDLHGGEADDDRFFLDEVLNKLYDFGGGEHKGSKKSQKRINVAKDYNADNENDAEENTDTIRHDTDSELPMTNSTKQSSVEVVTFINPLKKNKLSKAVEPAKKAPVVKEKKKNFTDKKLTIEKARFEVHRFGLSGYEKQQQRVFEQDRAIMLGAIPPKRQYVNYKEYQRNIRIQKRQERKGQSESQNKKTKKGKPRIEKSKSSSSVKLGGQVGRFKNGMLVLSSKDIQKLKVKAKK
ncbi:uncharacterized protein C1orf131 homolog [Ctenopharyngodon idella]|uniref:uncharacterized protein C1orf131 homolog n=1 Tax=Ctenopharyngodon idella TaxID=7959 RepID=UPI00223266FD|nr:uncharacterized protein C1orf131 homolog [Ctenopharyngodon idella]